MCYITLCLHQCARYNKLAPLSKKQIIIPLMKIFIETDRLYLREIVHDDAEGMFALDSDPEVHRYLGNKPIQTKDEAIQAIEIIRGQYVANGIGRWAVIEKATGDFAGWSGLKLERVLRNGHINYYDLGYRLLRKCWGKGYATETAAATFAYAFNEMKLKELYACAHAENIASQKVIQKTGFTYIETFDHNGLPVHWYKAENPTFEGTHK